MRNYRLLRRYGNLNDCLILRDVKYTEDSVDRYHQLGRLHSTRVLICVWVWGVGCGVSRHCPDSR